MKRMIFVFCFIFLFIFISFSQETLNDNEWKNKRIYTHTWVGYGSGFSFGVGADAQLFEYFSLGLESGLVGENDPAISIFPKFTFRPWNMEISAYAGVSFGYSTTYDFIWGIPYGLDVGYNIGSGILFVTLRSGMGWAVGIGYRMGFLARN